jgi:hypothetical protein
MVHPPTISPLDEQLALANLKPMTDAEITKAASLNGKRSWKRHLKKWGGKKAASVKMREVRLSTARSKSRTAKRALGDTLL